MKTILIVDDHESMRDSLASAFEKAEGFRTAGGIPSAAFALAYCEKLKPDLVMMDICTENGASGLDAAQAIKKAYPEIKVIVMTAFEEISYVPRAKAAGADAFIYKSRSLGSFVETAKAVIAGDTCFPEPKTFPMPEGEAPLTVREMEVLRLLCRHMTNKEIAAELYISENTVKFHKANMLAKTGFSKTVDLAFYMISSGWINPLY